MNLIVRHAAAAALLLSVSAAAMAETLGIGSPAPPLKVAKWVKGTPIQKFEKGKVYVLEFWASW